jgi:hypothetical protein
MALTTPIPEIPDSRQMNGIGCEQASFLLIPGVSDYPTGGYVVTGLQLRMPKGIISVSIDGWNATANGLGYGFSVIVPSTLSSNNIPIVPTTFNLYAYVLTTSAQVGPGVSLSGAIFIITVQGY